MDLTEISIPVTLYVRTTTKKYRVEDAKETTLELIGKMLADGNVDLKLVPGWSAGGNGAILIALENTNN